ncbi:MAG: histidine kinase [Cytophagales bacterium]|jgi:two-component system LytT family sensor kinase|nr:histidine kinase [Cytophagales bacterium]
MLTDRRYWIYHFFIAFVVSSLLAVEDFLESGNFYFKDLLFGLFTILLLLIPFSYLVKKIVACMNLLMPWGINQFKRFILESVLIITLVAILTSISILTKDFFIEVDDNRDNDFGFEIISLIMFFISIFMLVALHEFMALNEDNESLYLKSKILEKKNYLAKYEALKSQVNPHFLFNSLNVLSSLVYTDSKKSDLFIKKFADVFRYVLELNNENLVKVEREIDFLNSYLFLHKIRYGDSLQVTINLSTTILNKLIPPLSMQLVVENALKHSRVDADDTLYIYIEETESNIIVRNTYQANLQDVVSTGIGQNNLIEKYHLLGLEEPKFYISDNYYISELPVEK